MDPGDPAWVDSATQPTGPLAMLGVLGLAAWQAWLKFGGKKPDAAPVVAPVEVAAPAEVVDTDARKRLAALEHQTKTTADELARMRKTQQQDHDILGKLDERLDGIRDMLVFIRDRD